MSVLTAVAPGDGRALGDFDISTTETIQQQMQTAQTAAHAWAGVSAAQRAKILAGLRPILLEQLDSICDIIMQTTGKVATEVLLGEIYPLLDLLRYYEKQAEHILCSRAVFTSPFAFPGATASIDRRPFGVVAVISPWNFPFQLTLAPLLTALFAGNAVIFKPSELSLPVGRLIIELFSRLDLPPGLVQWAIGDAVCGQQLIAAGPDLIFFTGGLSTGRQVMRQAALHPVPVLLELGGKDAMLVFADAYLQRACAAALYGAFSNSGQVCVSTERLYVQAACFAEFLEMLLAGVAQLKVGSGADADLGAMTSPAQLALIEAHYQDAISKGAQASGPLVRNGNFIKPVLLWNVTADMLIMREENFGPLLAVQAFNDEAEAIALANDSDFGLNASIWSSDMGKAKRVASQLQVGNWVINDVLKNAGHPRLPFGGVKKSGFGRYHGAEGLRNFSYPVSGLCNHSHLDREPNWFPYSAQRYRQLKAYLDFVYGSAALYRRIYRNWQTLLAFRKYSAINVQQTWQNFKLMLAWKRND